MPTISEWGPSINSIPTVNFQFHDPSSFHTLSSSSQFSLFFPSYYTKDRETVAVSGFFSCDIARHAQPLVFVFYSKSCSIYVYVGNHSSQYLQLGQKPKIMAMCKLLTTLCIEISRPIHAAKKKIELLFELIRNLCYIYIYIYISSPRHVSFPAGEFRPFTHPSFQ